MKAVCNFVGKILDNSDKQNPLVHLAIVNEVVFLKNIYIWKDFSILGNLLIEERSFHEH